MKDGTKKQKKNGREPWKTKQGTGQATLIDLFEGCSILKKELTAKGYEDVAFFVIPEEQVIRVSFRKHLAWGWKDYTMKCAPEYFSGSYFDTFLSAEELKDA